MGVIVRNKTELGDVGRNRMTRERRARQLAMASRLLTAARRLTMVAKPVPGARATYTITPGYLATLCEIVDHMDDTRILEISDDDA